MENQKELRLPGFIYKPTPNVDAYREISEAIRENDDYCCCALEKNDDSKCMCKNFRLQEESGFCHCGRFYKLKQFETITILCAPGDSEHAFDLASSLTHMGFIITLPMYYDVCAYARDSQVYDELQKAKIHQADLVLVCNSSQSAVDFLAEGIAWAEELQKKIIYEYTEEISNED